MFAIRRGADMSTAIAKRGKGEREPVIPADDAASLTEAKKSHSGGGRELV